MIALDTNILVRLLVDDPSNPDQVAAARRTVTQQSSVYVPQIVQVETVWVLRRAYGFPKSEISKALHQLSVNKAYELEAADLFRQALEIYRDGTMDFSDALILVNTRARGLDLLTFDKALVGQPGVASPA
jgi:predicted nucleic-acid-binding protein